MLLSYSLCNLPRFRRIFLIHFKEFITGQHQEPDNMIEDDNETMLIRMRRFVDILYNSGLKFDNL